MASPASPPASSTTRNRVASTRPSLTWQVGLSSYIPPSPPSLNSIPFLGQLELVVEVRRRSGTFAASTRSTGNSAPTCSKAMAKSAAWTTRPAMGPPWTMCAASSLASMAPTCTTPAASTTRCCKVRLRYTSRILHYFTLGGVARLRLGTILNGQKLSLNSLSVVLSEEES